MKMKRIGSNTTKNVRRRIVEEFSIDQTREKSRKFHLTSNEVDLLIDNGISHPLIQNDATNTTIENTKSPHLLDSPASRTRGAMRRVDDVRQISPINEEMVDISDIPSEEPMQEKDNTNTSTEQTTTKRVRGRTKMNTVAVEQHDRLDITFNKFGQPVGKNSVGLSSFLGPLVREVVQVTLDDWRKLSTRNKEILWTSIQSRYNVEDCQKKKLFTRMGKLWSAGKSRLVKEICTAKTDEDLRKLKPDNISSVHDWMDFIKEKTSAKFKARSAQFKSMKKKQLPHTSSRKGFARLAEEMQNSCSDPSSVTRVDVWAKAHKKKNGDPVNSEVAEKLRLIEQVDKDKYTSQTNMDEDALTKVLGPDRVHIRGLGLGVSRSQLSIMTQRDNQNTLLEKEYHKLKHEIIEVKTMLKDVTSKLITIQSQSSEQFSNATMNEPVINSVPTSEPIVTSPSGINKTNAHRSCKLLDWCGSGEVVAEGRWSTNDPKVLVHHAPLGPLAVRVWVDVSLKPEAYLWRPSSEMSCIEDALGTTVAWPSDKVIMSS